MKGVEEKIKSGDKPSRKATRQPAEKTGKVIDLVSLLQESLGAKSKKATKRTASKRKLKKAA